MSGFKTFLGIDARIVHLPRRRGAGIYLFVFHLAHVALIRLTSFCWPVRSCT